MLSAARQLTDRELAASYYVRMRVCEKNLAGITATSDCPDIAPKTECEVHAELKPKILELIDHEFEEFLIILEYIAQVLESSPCNVDGLDLSASYQESILLSAQRAVRRAFPTPAPCK